MAVAKFVDEIFKAENEISIGIFIDAKKAFDTIDHKILLKKLRKYGFYGAELKLIENYLTNRYQVTEVDGVVSGLLKILAGVPQGSILGPLLFIIYINDLPSVSTFRSFLFADDTSLHMSDKNIKMLESKANTELERVGLWFRANNMVLNSKKTKYILFGAPKNTQFKLEIEGDIIDRVSNYEKENYVKLVGIALDEKLSFKHHINLIKVKLNVANFILAQSGKILTQEIRVLVYNSLVKSVLDFGSWVYGHCAKSLIDQLYVLQKKIVRNVVGARGKVHTNKFFARLGILKIPDIIDYNTLITGWKIWNSKAPENLCNGYEKITPIRNTRSALSKNFKVPFCKTSHMEIAPCYSITKNWNCLNEDMKNIQKLVSFKAKLMANTFERYLQEPPCKIKNCYACSLEAL